MEKYKFFKEYEFHINTKTLFEYISTPFGLNQWFADVEVNKENNIFNFKWDGTDHLSKIAYHKIGKAVRFEFLPIAAEDKKDPSFVEFSLNKSDLTKAVYLSVTDYSAMTNEDDLKNLWDGLIHTLKSKTGG